MNITPLSNHIIIKPLDDEKVTQSGIVLPESKEERPTQGEIVAVGPGKRNDKGDVLPLLVSVGQKVLFKKYGPDEFEFEGQKYLIGDEDDVLAVIG